MRSIRSLGRDIRRAVLSGVKEARVEHGGGASPTNVVIASNVGEPGSVHSTTARQSVRLRDGRVEERTETVTTTYSEE